tara:strand:+ start:1418 stop:1861 length:444 start_codon:yes stop_codon:yes gene_type:complete
MSDIAPPPRTGTAFRVYETVFDRDDEWVAQPFIIKHLMDDPVDGPSMTRIGISNAITYCIRYGYLEWQKTVRGVRQLKLASLEHFNETDGLSQVKKNQHRIAKKTKKRVKALKKQKRQSRIKPRWKYFAAGIVAGVVLSFNIYFLVN